MITLYSKPNCSFCEKAKLYLDGNSIEYKEVDITQEMDAYKMIKEKHSTVPQIYCNNTILVEGGWDGLKDVDPTILKQLVKLHES